MDHVQVQLDSMSRKKFLQIVYYDPELDPVLNEAIELLDAQIYQLLIHIIILVGQY